MRPKWWLYALSFSVAVNVAAVGTLVYYWAGPHGHTPPVPPGRHRPPLEDALDLGPAQRARLDSLRKSYLRALRPLRKQLHEERRRLSELLEEDQIDSLALKRHVDKIARLQAQMELLTVKHVREMSKVMSPKQRAEFHKLLRERMWRHYPKTQRKGEAQRRSERKQNEKGGKR